jgi:hypothetical protein
MIKCEFTERDQSEDYLKYWWFFVPVQACSGLKIQEIYKW